MRKDQIESRIKRIRERIDEWNRTPEVARARVVTGMFSPQYPIAEQVNAIQHIQEIPRDEVVTMLERQLAELALSLGAQ